MRKVYFSCAERALMGEVDAALHKLHPHNQSAADGFDQAEMWWLRDIIQTGTTELLCLAAVWQRQCLASDR